MWNIVTGRVFLTSQIQTFRGCDNFNSKAKMYLKYSSIMLGGKEVQLYLLFMLRKLHGKNPLNAYQVRMIKL